MKNNTATPYALTAIILVAGVVYGEYWLNNLQQTKNSIPLVASQNAADEDGGNIPNLVLKNEQKQLATTLLAELNSGLGVQALLLDPRLTSLSEDTRPILQSYIAVELGKAKKYPSAIELLNQIGLRQRLLYDSQFSLAYALFKTKQFDKALGVYQEVLKDDPQHQSAALNTGLLLIRMQRCEEAIVALEYSIEISHGIKKSKSHAGLADCYVGMKQYELAQKHLSLAIEYRPSYAKNWLAMAALAKAQGSAYSVVNDLYQKASQLEEKRLGIILEWAKYQMKMLDFNGAISTLRSALSRAKKSIKIRRLLAISYLEAAKPNNARKQAKKLLKLENSAHRETYAKVLIEYTQGHYKKAYVLGKKLSNKKLHYRYLKALSAAKAGKRSAAAKVLRKLAATKAYRYRASRQLALIHKARKNYLEAEEIVEQLTQVQPHSASLWRERARLAAKQDHIQRAIEYLDQGISNIKVAEHENPKALIVAKGKFLVLQGNMRDAITLMDYANKQYPNDLRLIKLLADNLYLNGQHIESYEHYKLLLSRNPDDVDLLFRLADISIEYEKWQEGISYLNALLERQADHVEARYLLAKSYCHEDKPALCKQQATLTLRLKHDHSGAKALLSKVLDKGKV